MKIHLPDILVLSSVGNHGFISKFINELSVLMVRAIDSLDFQRWLVNKSQDERPSTGRSELFTFHPSLCFFPSRTKSPPSVHPEADRRDRMANE